MRNNKYREIDARRFELKLKSETVSEKIHRKEAFRRDPADNRQIRGIVGVLRNKHNVSEQVKNIYLDAQREEGSNTLVKELGDYIAYKCNATCIPGPIKGIDGSMRKILDFSEGGYRGNTGLLKDVVRITLIGDSVEIYSNILSLMRIFCTRKNRYAIIKDKVVTPDQDTCGYSGANIVVNLPCNRPGEVQVNVRSIMYGKMSQKDYCTQLNTDVTAYTALSKSYGIEGGLGHWFYEIWRVDKFGENGKEAAALSKDYYARLREYPRELPNPTAFLNRLNAFKTRNQSPKH